MVIGVGLSPWKYHAQCHPNRVALHFYTPDGEEQRLTWQQLCQRIDQYQACLVEQGMDSGDVLTLVGKNHSDTLFWLLAAYQQGIVCALTMPQPEVQLISKLNTLYSPGSQAYVWFAPDVESGTEESDTIEWPLKKVSFVESKMVKSDVDYSKDNLASIIFTSGSTGVPKAVAHCHSQHFASAQGLLERFHFCGEDTWLLSLPLYHVSGLSIVYRWLQAGACLKVGRGDLPQDIQGVTHASLVPTQLKRLLDSQQSLSLTHVLLGGSHIPETLAQQAAQLGIETWLGYGMTEAASTVTAKQVDSTPSAGRLLPRRALKIANNTIFVGGDTLAQGYYFQGQLNSLTDQEGWFNTKDLGRWLDDELEIIGRADNLFISGGENVHCEEIEAVLNQHPDIQLAMVIPVEDAEFGARPVAAVMSSNSVTKTLGDEWCTDKLEKFKWPLDYFEMPQSLSHGGIKVSRSALKEWFASHQQSYQVIK